MITRSWCTYLKSMRSRRVARASDCQCRRYHTDKKENQVFLINKEIQNGAVAMPYMTNGLLIYMGNYLRIFSYIRKPFLIYDFATAPL
jgi:hypothetical protein